MVGYPQRYVILDTETNSASVPAKVPTQKLTFRLGCVLVVDPDSYEDDEPHYLEFRDRSDFRAVLCCSRRSERTIYVFAHNMGFDSRIVGIWDLVADGTLSLMPQPDMPGAKRYKEPLFIADDHIFIVRLFRRDGQRIVLLDTVQWFKESLEKLGQKIRHPKLMRPDADAPDDVWMRYCRGDVDTLHAALLRLWAMLQRHNIPDWDYTPASLSRRFYRMRFERKRIKRPEDPQILGLDRLAYYGGMLECFRVGEIEGPIYQLDINSLYPHVMSQNSYPCEVHSHGDHKFGDGKPDSWDPCTTTAEVTIETDDCPYPVRGSDQTYYAVGRIKTVLCGPELATACDAGHVRGIGRWVRYRTADLFSGWATYWRRTREFAQDRKDTFTDGIVKGIMNSLHGKFGQQTGEWTWVGKTHPSGSYSCGRIYHRSFRRWMETRTINGDTWERGESGEDQDSFVPIAAWTASYGRVYMRWLIETAGVDSVFYVATDSILTNQAGYRRLLECGMIDGTVMGKFKVEAKAERGAVWNVNQIDLDTLKRRSGVRKGSLEIEPGIWSVESWESFARGVCLTGQDSVSIENILIRPSLSYCRRQVLSGGMTKPWWIDCWYESPEAIASKPVWGRLKDRE